MIIVSTRFPFHFFMIVRKIGGYKRELTDLVFHSVVFDGGEWTARGDQGPPFGPVVDILGLGFVQSGRIAQREYNGPLHVLSHLSDDVLGKGIGLRGGPDQCVRFHLLDHAIQIHLVLVFPFRIISREWDLSGR